VPKVLIIGGDSLLGRALTQRLIDGGIDVTVTSRGKNAAEDGRIRLDLAQPPEEWPSLPAADCWVLCAAVSRLAECRDDPALSHRINVEAPVALGRRAAEGGAQIVFLSTSQVFDGSIAHCPPGSPVCPQNLYGRQKAEAESRLAETSNRALAVVRLTKVLDPTSALINGWIAALREGMPFHPFRDMVLSQVSLAGAIRILERVIDRRSTGVLQVSGPRDITYEDAAKHIARRFGADLRLIEATSAAEAGILPEERPAHTTLDTSRIGDANFGMFPEDMETSKEMHAIQKTHENQWPRTILAATAKNHKERTIEIIELLGDTLPPTGAVQSTDPTVLDKIKRKNPPMEALSKMADIVEKHGGQSEAELILCIEGDDKKKHFKTVSDMLNANYSFIRMYQFMMLPGTRSASKEHREKYGFQTRYRVLPRCFGTYRFRDETFPCVEIEEIVIATNTMPHEDYQDCRDLHLSVEIFNNDSIFFDLIQFLKFNDIPRSTFITATHRRILDKGGPLAKLYAEFRAEEEKNLWQDIGEVETFVKEDGVIDRYVDGEFGTNELYKYRALAVFEHIEALHETAFSVARDLLRAQDAITNEAGAYLDELSEFSLLRKSAPLETDRAKKRPFHFDLARLLEDRFRTHPSEVECPDGMEMEIFHTDQQRKLIDSYVNQYTTSLIGLGRILLRANMNRLYRTVRRLDGNGETVPPPKEVLAMTDRLGSDQKA